MTSYQSYAETIARKAKRASRKLRSLSSLEKDRVLLSFRTLLLENIPLVLEANQKDLLEGKEKNLSQALMDRLLLDEKRIQNMAKGVLEIVGLPDPVGEVVRGTTLPNGLSLVTKRVPLGVIMTIFESRPNVIADIASLCFKSGNACILRGGKEALFSNQALVALFHQAIQSHFSEPEILESVSFVEITDREAMLPFFQLESEIDMIVPRGGEALISFVSQNSKIPVVKHDKGVTNLYLSASARPEIVLDVLTNSKLQRTGVCNALENLFIHKDYPGIVDLLSALQKKGAKILGDKTVLALDPSIPLADESDFYTEFLDERLSLKIVSSVEEAISLIEMYSSGHTECILSEDYSEILQFQNSLDSAAIFVNCSTRFHDGGEFGLGAEVGISTGKLHVRGPMGLIHLTTTTTYITGTGQIRA